jgi:nitrate reductase NapAB chaperone NapD
MAISGLAILLSPETELRESALLALQDHPQLELGPSNGDRISAVLDTPDTHQDRRAFRQLEKLSGVLRVDLVCVYLDEELTDAPSVPSGADHE